MAAVPKTLEIVTARSEGPSTRILTITEIGGTGLGEIGGKYVIVHTGLVIGEKPVKRAYSLMLGDAGDGHAEIAVKRIGGHGATHMHEVGVGTQMTFSGPWGKLIPDDGIAAKTLLVATDTGITSALGIVERAARIASNAEVTVLWLRAAGEDFLGVDHVRARVERAGGRFSATEIPPARSVERPPAALPHVVGLAHESSATHVVGTGDGAVVYPLKAALPGRVARVEDVRVECFFNNPERKSG